MAERWARRAPLTGIVAVVMFAVAFAISGSTPDFDASSKQISDYFSDQTTQVITSLLVLYGAVLLVFFSATLRSAFAGSVSLARLVFMGGTLMAVGLVILAGVNFTVTDLVNSSHADRIDPGALQAINALDSDLFFPIVLGTSVFLVSAGLATLSTGALPRWLGWAALVLGVISFTPVGFFAFILSGVWMVIAAVILLQRGGAGAAPSDTPSATMPS
jgi:hypothetical protein